MYTTFYVTTCGCEVTALDSPGTGKLTSDRQLVVRNNVFTLDEVSLASNVTSTPKPHSDPNHAIQAQHWSEDLAKAGSIDIWIDT